MQTMSLELSPVVHFEGPHSKSEEGVVLGVEEDPGGCLAVDWEEEAPSHSEVQPGIGQEAKLDFH